MLHVIFCNLCNYFKFMFPLCMYQSMAFIVREGKLLGAEAVRLNSLSSLLASRNFHTKAVVPQQAAITAEAHIHDEPIKPTSEIPGPRRWPFVGTVLSMILDKDFDRRRLDKFWKKQVAEYGPIFRFDLPQYDGVVLVANPDDCEALTRATMDNPIRKGFFSLGQIRKEAVDNYFEMKAGLLHENGEEWKRVRSRIQTPMLKPKNVTSYLAQMDQVSLDFMEKIATFQKELGEMPSDFQTELYKWSLESVGLVTLNRRLGCLDKNISDDSEGMTLLHEAHNMINSLNHTEIGLHSWRYFATPTYKALVRSHDEFLRVADQNIMQTEAQLLTKEANFDEELTLMESLLLTPGLTRKDVVTLILDMLFAGIDTTSHTVAFTLYLLAKNPQCQAKLQEEIDRVLGDHTGPITAKHMGQFTYLKMVLKESHRVFPLVLGAVRELTQDIVLGGYLVPKGFTVVSFNMHMAQNEDLFPRAKEFIPERWGRDRPLGPIHPFAHMPFGLGTRMCVGRRIAEQEIYAFLVRAMQRYSVDYKYKDMDFYTRLIAVPSEPLRFTFTERH